MPQRRDVTDGRLTQQLMEAKDLLHHLRVFAETAEWAIEAGRRIKTLRAEEKRLQRSLAAASVNRDLLREVVADTDTKNRELTKTVISNWLIFLKLKQQEASVDERLAKARADWARTALRLDRVLKKQAEQRQRMRDLRAESATLAAEIGRMKRQIVNVRQETLLIDDHLLDLQTTTRQLRHNVSAGLRDILVAK